MTSIDTEYLLRMDALTGTERVARCLSMLTWTREMLARQLERQHGQMPEHRLKLEVALRLYGGDLRARALIQSALDHVSG